MPARLALALALAAAALFSATALAALPASKSRLEAHDHATKGDNWHVEVEVGKDRRTLATVVLYSERCDETILAEKVAVSEAGDVTINGEKKGTTYELTARFASSRELTGTMRIAKAGCELGPLEFTAKAEGKNHDHKSHHHHSGPKYPPLGKATKAQRAQAERLRREAHQVARTRFATYRAARSLGYKRRPGKGWKRPLPFHLRYTPYERDRTIFSASRAESLVYWWPRQGHPVLIGFMFRVPAPARPKFAGPIPIYHRHPGADGRLGDSQMTHVWLTRDLRSAWANCLPVQQLEKALPRFRYSRPGNGVSGGETKPCEPVR